ncbi:hypothetical protein [Legionella brunensis]|uniref:Uncharacterized protein n=1 Tax=Legionella brunensis TaxID=29422 RepID=A0A0W0SUE7_9GAMM|nr:hypothetical protein [Legionella brunensis]KTC86897.1 hypothetical protein Lbru_0126 [Legionella brunensis]
MKKKEELSIIFLDKYFLPQELFYLILELLKKDEESYFNLMRTSKTLYNLIVQYPDFQVNAPTLYNSYLFHKGKKELASYKQLILEEIANYRSRLERIKNELATIELQIRGEQPIPPPFHTVKSLLDKLPNGIDLTPKNYVKSNRKLNLILIIFLFIILINLGLATHNLVTVVKNCEEIANEMSAFKPDFGDKINCMEEIYAGWGEILDELCALCGHQFDGALGWFIPFSLLLFILPCITLACNKSLFNHNYQEQPVEFLQPNLQGELQVIKRDFEINVVSTSMVSELENNLKNIYEGCPINHPLYLECAELQKEIDNAKNFYSPAEIYPGRSKHAFFLQIDAFKRKFQESQLSSQVSSIELK